MHEWVEVYGVCQGKGRALQRGEVRARSRLWGEGKALPPSEVAVLTAEDGEAQA